MSLRHLEKFSNSVETYTWPTNQFEWQSSQAFKNNYMQGNGQHFSFNPRGNAPAFLDDGIETMRFIDLQTSMANAEADMDNMRAQLWRMGTGNLYLLNSDGTRRVATARLEAAPNISVRVDNDVFFPAALTFRRLSFWQGLNLDSTGSPVTIISTGTINLTALGNVPIYGPAAQLIIKIQSNVSGVNGGFGPIVTLTNSNTGESMTITTSALGSGSQIKIDCSANRIYFSNDSGANYSSLWPNTVLGNQRSLMTFAQGANSIAITGVGNATVSWSYYPTYF